MDEILLSDVLISDGETLWLESNCNYKGTLYLTDHTNVTIAGKGPYPATIDAEAGNGIVIRNCKNIRIQGLDIQGNGWRKSKKAGIHIIGTENIDVCGVEVSGFREGILVQEGCSDVEMSGCFVHDVGRVGIGIGGNGGAINQNIHITHCKTYDCAGDPTFYRSHSGSGIVIGRTHDALVEYCEAAGNGWAQRQRYANGPIGMWCWGQCERIVFRYCISRDNRTQPGAVDGGGFDFDGSVCDCLMEYDYSYHNEGAGYLLCEYGSGEKWDNNVVKHCVSIGDACRVPQYGSVHYCGHIGRKIDRGIVEKSLLVPAVGRSAVSNDFMVEESKENEVLSCVMVTDGTRPVASDNPVVKFTDNKQWANPQLYEDIMRTFPRIVEPRKLHELPVFQLLEESRCANVLEKGDSESLFGDMTKKSEKEMETCLLTLEIGGKDLEGCNYKGNVQLSYDNIGPCMAGKFSADAFLDFPVSWEEKGTSYTVRAYARTQSPSVSAYLYVTDDNKQEKRSYFAGTCAEYHSTDIRFTGAEDPGRRIGIRVEKGCLLIQKIEIVENHGSSDEAQRKSLMAPEKWHYFGDVEQKKDGGFLLHNTSALHCEITIHSAAVLHCSVQGRGSLQFGGTKLYIAEGKESLVTIPVDKTRGVDRLCISRIGEEPGELEIKDVYLEILSEEE